MPNYQRKDPRFYWKKRSLEVANKRFKDITTFEEILQEFYDEQAEDMGKTVNDFISKYAEDNKLSIEVAQKHLKPIEQEKYQKLLEKHKKGYQKTGDEVYLKEIQRLQTRKKLTRLQALQNQLQLHAMQISVEETNMIEQFLTQHYKDTYLDEQGIITGNLGINAEFDIPSIEVIAPILQYPYTGKMFSELIWENNQKMINNLVTTLTRGMVQGNSIDKLSKVFGNLMYDSTGKHYSTFNIRRIIRTESAFVQERAKQNANQLYGVDKYEIIVAGDERTCEICGGKDGKIEFVEKRQEGWNAPPFHPQCRCTTAPYVSDEDLDKATKDFIKKAGEIKNKNKKPKKPIKKKPTPVPPKPKQVVQPRQNKLFDNVKSTKKQFEDLLPKANTSVSKQELQMYLMEADSKIEKAPRHLKEFWHNFEDKIKIRQIDDGVQPCYMGNLDKLQIDLSKDITGKARKVNATYFHEVGHLMDQHAQWYFDKRSAYGMSELNSKFGDLLHQEGQEYIEKITKGVTNKNIKKQMVFKEMAKYGQAMECVSDVLNGISKGEYGGAYVHGKDYWEGNPKLVNAEAFAEMFSATMNGDTKQVEFIKEVFPKAYKEFNQMIMHVIEKMAGF